MSNINDYEKVIGLEVHVELSTKAKIFCGCPTDFGAKPNTQICPVCAGLPGGLPVLNKQVALYATKVGVATNCRINQRSAFDRKNYFYPDNPQNYQITQLYRPICQEGFITISTQDGMKDIRIKEIHMEEDAGKVIHNSRRGESYIDYNRSGVPLIEIVTEPDFRTSEEVIEFLDKLRMTIQYLKVSDCKLNEGSMRVDVNLSVRKKGDTQLGTRTEMKNLNSFRSVAAAIEHEALRQIELINNDEIIELDTRRWDEDKNESFSMRSKENSREYRYFPDPDLPDVIITDEELDNIKGNMPLFHEDRIKKYVDEYALPEYDAQILTSHIAVAEFFEKTTAICNKPKKVSNWIMGEMMKLQKERNFDIDVIPFSPENLARIIDMLDMGIINMSVAKEVFEKVFDLDVNPEEYVIINRLCMNNDEDEIKEAVLKVLAENEKSVADYKNGKDRALGYLIGQAMSATNGKANPEMIKKILEENL